MSFETQESLTPAEKISNSLGQMVSKMSQETIEEYRNLAASLLTMQESVKKSTESAIKEIEAHISWLQTHDVALADRLKTHVEFVNDALQTKGLIMESFKAMQTRYERPSP